MKDKVQKIREEVERLMDELIQEKEKGFGSDADDACILELQNVLTYIDSLQEEPTGNVWHDSNKEQPESGRTVAVWNPKIMDGEILSRCVEVYSDRIWAYLDDLLNLDNSCNFGKNLQEEPVSEYLNIESMIESYKQRLISQANGVKNSPLIDMCLVSYKHGINETLDTLNLSNVQRTGKNWKEPKFKVGDRIKFKGVRNENVTRVITNIQKGDGGGFRYLFADGSIYSIGDDGIELVEESVSEELEKVSEAYALDDYIKPWRELVKKAFKAGAKWQETKDQSTIELAEDHAMLSGMEKMKEEMMAKAIDGEVLENYNGKVIKYDETILDEKLSDCKVFDKVKIIVIKDE